MSGKNRRGTCKRCHRKATRNHAHHETGELERLCEIHYAKWNPESVLTRFRDDPPWRISERKLLLEEMRKHLPEEKIREVLDQEPWFHRLVKQKDD